MKKILLSVFIIVFAVTIVFAENSTLENEMKQTKSGLKYKITHHGNGEHAKIGDVVVLHYTGKLENGEKFDSSYDRNKPFEFELGKGRVIKGWDEGVALLQIGDKATFIIPPELGYGARDLGVIPPNSTLVFDVELLEIKKPHKIEKFDIEGKAKIKTESGLEFILVEKGSGKKAAKGYTVKVHYSGYLDDGTMFDSSYKRMQPFEFTIGMKQVIAGWDEAVAMMREGDKARIILPYQLAYGEKGYPGVIPEKATLTFDIELLEVK
jgi:peptidylprolyl isomerase